MLSQVRIQPGTLPYITSESFALVLLTQFSHAITFVHFAKKKWPNIDNFITSNYLGTVTCTSKVFGYTYMYFVLQGGRTV